MSSYAIKNLEKYATEMRLAAANYISNDYSENLDDFITIKQLESFIVSKCDGYDEKGYQPTPAYYRNMQWGRNLAWDQEQREFLVRSGNSEKQITAVGPIWFSESAEKSLKIQEDFVS